MNLNSEEKQRCFKMLLHTHAAQGLIQNSLIVSVYISFFMNNVYALFICNEHRTQKLQVSHDHNIKYCFSSSKTPSYRFLEELAN